MFTGGLAEEGSGRQAVEESAALRPWGNSGQSAIFLCRVYRTAVKTRQGAFGHKKGEAAKLRLFLRRLNRQRFFLKKASMVSKGILSRLS